MTAPLTLAPVDSAPLRAWQRAALVSYLRQRPRDFLAVATPGAGKTNFALRIAAELLSSGTVQAITVVAPTEHLKTQWALAATRAGIRLDPTFRNAMGRASGDFHGVVLTYSQVAAHPALHRARTTRRRTLVVLDEVHHAGDAMSWGDAVREAFEPATRRLALTGTPFRSDTNPIPFVRYGFVRGVRQDAPVTTEPAPAYRLERADLPLGQGSVYVMLARDGSFHDEATAYLRHLEQSGSSPNTVRSYGAKLGWYLSWCLASGLDWRRVALGNLTRWKHTVQHTPFEVGRGREPRTRSSATVSIWMTACTEFYRYAAANGHVDSQLVASFFEERYATWGATGGGTGEKARVRQVKRHALAAAALPKPPQWIEDPDQRLAVLELPNNVRDRFLVFLLMTTGLRIGEALGLHRCDMHLLADSAALGCSRRGPHVHVTSRPGAADQRAKGRSRVVPVTPDLVQRYSEYQDERAAIFGDCDDNDAVFVNLYRRNLGDRLRYDTVKDLFEKNRLTRTVAVLEDELVAAREALAGMIRESNRGADVKKLR